MPSLEELTIREDGLAVGCIRCNTWIEKGSPYEVQLFLPSDEGMENPIGPYCENCLSSVRVCSFCDTPHIIDETITYKGGGKWVCNGCVDSLVVCPSCEQITPELGKHGLCSKCEEKTYYTCTVCGEEHKWEEQREYSQLYKKQYSSYFKKYGTSVCNDCHSTLIKRFKKKEVYECKKCGGYFFGSRDYCGNCIESTRECGVCGNRRHAYNYVYIAGGDGKVVCSDCYTKLKKCDYCGDLEFKSKMSVVKGRVSDSHICSSCSTGLGECSVCLGLHSNLIDGKCRECYNLHSQTCNSCGNALDSRGSCSKCCPGIKSYHTPFPLMFQYEVGDKYESCFLGFENEMIFKNQDLRGDDQGAILSSLLSHYPTDFLQLQSDSSINGYGCEMISQPHTLNAFNKTDWSPLFQNFKVNDSCGLHIHISNSSFDGSAHLYKFTQFIHSNTELMNLLARRDYSDYNRKMDKVSSVVKRAKGKSSGEGPEKYHRVNLSRFDRSKGTAEVRMFRGASNLMELMGSVQLCHALVAYTRNIGMRDTNPAGFICFFEGKKEYKELNELWVALSKKVVETTVDTNTEGN